MWKLIPLLLIVCVVGCSNPVSQDVEFNRISGVISDLDYQVVVIANRYYGGYFLETGIELQKVVYTFNLITSDGIIRPSTRVFGMSLFIFNYSGLDPSTEFIFNIIKEK